MAGEACTESNNIYDMQRSALGGWFNQFDYRRQETTRSIHCPRNSATGKRACYFPKTNVTEA